MIGLLVLALAQAAQDWEYREGLGFVNPATMERRSPEELHRQGLKLRDAGHFAAAARLFGLVGRHAKDAALSETARYDEAEARFRAGEFFEACRLFEDFVARFPQSDRSTEAKRRIMESALELAYRGHAESVLGVPLISSSKAGVEKLREALRRYPREDFSAEFYQHLGLFFYGRGDYDSAEAEFTTVIEQYPDSPIVVPALFHLGRIRLDRFDDVPYDIKTLKDAKRHFARFIEEADRMRRLSPRAEEWVEKYLPEARAAVGRINELMAEKELRTAEYYLWKGYPRSAAVSYRAIIRAFPQTKAAATARRRLLEMGEPPPGGGPLPRRTEEQKR